MDNVIPESTCLMEVEKERAGRLGKAEQRVVVVVIEGRRGSMTPVVAAMDVELAMSSNVVRTNFSCFVLSFPEPLFLFFQRLLVFDVWKF